MRRLLPLTALLVLAAAAPAGADINLGSGARPQAIATGDFNSDGRQDLAIADISSEGKRVFLRLGNGDGTFRGEGTLANQPLPEDLAVADFTADGNEDLVVAARLGAASDVAYAYGAGNGSFEQRGTSELPGTAHSLAIGDFDPNGWADLVAAAANHVAVRFDVRRDTRGSLDIPLGGVRSVAIGDFDGNGFEDIVAVAAGDEHRVVVLTGKGGRQFDTAKVHRIPNVGAAVAVGDFDADGRHDVVVPVPGRDRVLVRLGNGDGTLRESAPDVAVGGAPVAVAVADIDADGREDLVVANSGSDSVSVRLGNGDGTFRDGGELAAGDKPVDVAVGDFDADGRQDFATANQDGASVTVRLGAGELAGNLLLNGGFEQGLGARLPVEAPTIPGWIATGGMTFLRYGTHPHFGVPSWLDAARFVGGRHLLWGGDSTGHAGVTDASQTVAVTGEAEAIDAGRAVASLSAQLGGALAFPDTMTATAEFLDADGAALAVLQVGPVTAAERRNVTTLLRRAGSAAVPPRTRRIRVTLTSRDTDRYSSAIADNVKLTLTTRPPELPAPPPAFGPDTRVTIALAARRAPVRVRVVNGNAFAVSGTLRGRRFAVAANGRTTVRPLLTKPQRRRLRHKGRVALRLAAVVTDPAGNRRTVSRRVSVRRVS